MAHAIGYNRPQGVQKRQVRSIKMQPATNDVTEVNLSALLMLLYKLLQL